MKEVPHQITAFGLSDVGLVREKNEDFWAECPEDSLFVLADGMGGHRAGDVASKAAVNGVCAVLKDSISNKSRVQGPEQVARAMKLAMQEVNRILYRMSQQDHHLRGMGTTLVCLILLPTHAVYAHVGDSRIYLLRDKKLQQMTEDHSLLRELIDMGQLSHGQAIGFEYKNILTRAIGTEPSVEPTAHFTSIKSGDLFLLCSDGLTDHLHDSDIEALLIQYPSIDEAAKAMVKVAKQRGGHDNITLLLVKVES